MRNSDCGSGVSRRYLADEQLKRRFYLISAAAPAQGMTNRKGEFRHTDGYATLVIGGLFLGHSRLFGLRRQPIDL